MGKKGLLPKIVVDVNTTVQKNIRLEQLVTIDEVKKLLRKISEKSPDILKNLRKVIICNRPKQVDNFALSSVSQTKLPFFAAKSTIELYPYATIDGESYFLLDNNNTPMSTQWTMQEAKKNLLQTFCRQIGYLGLWSAKKFKDGQDFEGYCDEITKVLSFDEQPLGTAVPTSIY